MRTLHPEMPNNEGTPLLGQKSRASFPPSPSSSSKASGASAAPAAGDGAPLLFDRASLCLLLLSGLCWCGYAAWQIFYLVRYEPRATFSTLAPPLALMFMLTSLPLSLYDVAHHFARYRHPIQRLYVRILLLPPIYSIESYVAVVAPSHLQFAMVTFRECYECVALLAVFHLACETLGKWRDVAAILNEGAEVYASRRRAELAAAEALAALDSPGAQPGGGSPSADSGGAYAALGGGGEEPGEEALSRTERALLAILDGSIFLPAWWLGEQPGKQQQQQQHRRAAPSGVGTVRLIIPFCCFRWKLGVSFLNRCRWGVAQYVLVRVVCSVVQVSLESVGRAGDGNLGSVGSADLWITLLINVSQLWALYCLIFFASVLWPALRPLRPINKFLLVKVMVFGFWWQQVMLDILDSAQALNPLAANKGEDYSVGLILQNVLITMEVMIIALLHHFIFGVGDFLRPEMQAALLHNRLQYAKRFVNSSYSSGGAGSGGGEGVHRGRERDAAGGEEAEGGAAAGALEARAGAAAAGEAAPEGGDHSPGSGSAVTSPAFGSTGRPTPFTDLLMLDVASDTARVIQNASTAVASTVISLGRIALTSPPRKPVAGEEEGVAFPGGEREPGQGVHL
jgi:hypothetical protein